jgi:mRNA interferase RelE/StbE
VPWSLEVTGPAGKDLADLPPTQRQAVRRALDRLVDDPSSVDLKKLAGRSNEWRLRVGRWRLVLRLDTSTATMYVLRVLPRSRAYRD